MFDAINNVVTTVNGVVWGWPMIILLLGTHIFMTFRTGFIQRHSIGKGIKLSVTKDPEAEGEVSQFGALTTALAATIGTGNIIGVGTAIAMGGPGAVLWIWLSGVFGIATKYSESLIAVKYRVKTEDGRMQGGAFYALERGLNMKWLGMLFAILAGLASFGIGCATQVNAIATVANENFNIPPLAVGIVIAALTAFVIFGGIKSIANVCEKLVPFMAIFYVLARGLFSNESGMGSAPIAAAAAQTRNPVRQALVSSTGTFWDTVVVCLMTGLVLVTTIMKNPNINADEVSDGGVLTSLAFGQIPVLGPLILTLGIITFAYSTILGWAYYGERCVEYFAGRFGKGVLIGYRCLYIAVAVIAPVVALDLVWLIADTLNAFMAVPNLIAVLLLSNEIVRETKKYINNLDLKDETPVPVIKSKK